MKALKWAKVEPESIGYIETHGTGTVLGDPIEVEALNRVFGKSEKPYCALGSVKSNIGHLDAAAGVAGLIKAILALKYKQIPPTLNYTSPNPKIDFNKSAFYINTELKNWTNKSQPLRAGVSSFGIGGTNAHVILEEAPDRTKSSSSRDFQLVVISGKTESSLNQNIRNLIDHLKTDTRETLPDIAYTLQIGRQTFGYRKFVVCNSKDGAIQALNQKLSSKSSEYVAGNSKAQTIFMFSGQGSQYVNMGLSLYEKEPLYREHIDTCNEIVRSKTGIDLKTVLFSQEGEDSTSLINQTEFAQPILFTIEYALSQLLISWGIKPDLLIGHSIGEYVAACLSGVFSLEDALSLVISRGKLMQKAPTGIMLSVSLSKNELSSLLSNNHEISIAAINSSELCVVSGKQGSIEEFQQTLHERSIASKILQTSHAFHSYLMDDILPEYEKEVKRIKIHHQQIPFVSNLTGKPARDNEISKSEYWVRQLREPVKFSDGIEIILGQGACYFIEVGPGKALSTFVNSHKNKGSNHKVINTIRHSDAQENDLKYLIGSIGKLWQCGLEPDWTGYYREERRNKVSLPTYAFDKIEYPVNVDAFRMISEIISDKHLISNDLSDWFHVPSGELSSSMNIKNESAEKNINTSLISIKEKLIDIWQKFLGRSDINEEDDFFEIGGDSLKATTLIGRINNEFNIELSIANLFKESTIRKLSEYIYLINPEESKYSIIEKAKLKDHYVLSSAQKRLLFLYEFDKTSLAYNMPQVVKLEGKIDRERLDQCI